jgi:hypothetical protein
MSFDPDPSLRAELDAALALLLPQIEGLSHLEMVSAIPTDLIAEFNAASTTRSHRRDLIVAVLHALDAVVSTYATLVADGYPDLPPIPLLPSIGDELAAELAVIEAAIAVFQTGQAETGQFNPQGVTNT